MVLLLNGIDHNLSDSHCECQTKNIDSNYPDVSVCSHDVQATEFLCLNYGQLVR